MADKLDAMEIMVKNLEAKTQKMGGALKMCRKANMRGLSGGQDQFELQLALLEWMGESQDYLEESIELLPNSLKDLKS